MMPILKPTLLAALAINVAIGIGAAVHSQTAGLGSSSTGLTLSSGTTWTAATTTSLTGHTTSGNLIIASGGGTATCIAATANGGTAIVPCGQPQRPAGAIFHQVVDKYFDADGNQLEVKSATHAIDADCQPGRRQQDLIAQDDGKGRVQFAQTRLPSEPATGQKPVTKEGIIKATLAIKHTAPDPAQTQLAEAR